jgi:hypothetical protein
VNAGVDLMLAGIVASIAIVRAATCLVFIGRLVRS